MWKRKQNKEQSRKDDSLEIKDLSIDEVRKAIHMYADHKSGEIPLSVLIKSDLTLDYQLLAPYLHGTPKQRYYMSRETYELFTEENQQLAHDLDRVQQAVDQYMQQTQEPPIIEGDPYKKISYFMLESLGLLSDPQKETFI
ncbi:DUF3939 domain-containing protein [Halobacillus shinanisalinarum]|uniref:DUF3939 domain-containing protein n=1 Tax=Halobacillus shinanisalinarum TaxID=2932258 RepID=A0ABY4GXA2_9BACI|nr:DUF3939 domain-containing protein [Halobacillus shinanisalinarum]UOQ92786.1 DUF3939 domain-containing protein [Halobacillus shinanisalinarum]